MTRFKTHWTEVPNHIDMVPYEDVYRKVIHELENGKIFVELGVRDGCSARIIMDALGDRDYKLYLIDIEDNIYLDELKEDPRVTFVHGDALREEIIHMFDDTSIDFLHVDVDPHTYEQTRAVHLVYAPKMTHTGIMIYHDCTPDFGVYGFIKSTLDFNPHYAIEYAAALPDSPHTAPAIVRPVHWRFEQ